MAGKKRKTPGMGEVKPGVWELIVEAGRDPVSGKYRQVTKRFHGTFRAAKTDRPNLLAEVSQGRHSGTQQPQFARSMPLFPR